MGRGELSLTVALAVVASAALPLRVAAARPARASFGRGAVSELRSMWPASGDSRLARMRASLGLRPELDSMPGAAPPPRRKGVKEIEAEFVATHGPGTTVPTQFDAREQWPDCATMRQIKDQGHCGSCWAFGAAEAFSDRICVALGRNVTISENDLLSCCGETTCGGCDGGGFSGSWAYFNTTGAVSEECDPYFDQKGCQHPGCEPVWPTPACSKTCKDSESWTEAKHFVGDYYSVPADETAIMQEIMTHGPIQTGMLVFDSFANYTSGIYNASSGKWLGMHSIKLLGWGEENGTPYWLLANSWTRNWGEDGYFRIVRGHGDCEVKDMGHAGIPI